MKTVNDIKSLPSDKEIKEFEAYVKRIKLMHALFFPELYIDSINLKIQKDEKAIIN